jgi:cellulose synthase/poly-beta-1,6-N-acetylglucosamine synthase-like glycosyltransferase
MYLAEDRVRGESYVNMKISLRFSYSPFVDPMLGTRVKTRRSMDSSLRQVRVCRYRHAGSGAHINICPGNGTVDLIFLGFQVPELVSQRRRWLNGSFFAAIHSTVKFHYIYRSSHSFWRKFMIHVELIYQTFNLIFSWFALVGFPM